MEKEVLFAKTLEYIKNVAKDQGNIVSKEQVETAFEPLGFAAEQMEMVYDYLNKQKIGVEEAVDPDAYLSAEDVDYLETYLEELEALERVSDGEKEAIILSGMTTKDFAGYCEWEKEDGEIGCGLRYVEFTALNTYEIQKLKKQVIELEKEIKELKNET